MEVKNLHKAFGSHSVLSGVDLVIPAGSITAILGPSGSGKTTLLRLLAGFEHPDAGSITIGGTVVADRRSNVPVERRRIGYVSQEGSLFPHLSVAANVGFGLPRRQRGSSRVEQLLALVDLEELGGRYPHQLSGGQQQRVALARALAIEPAVVLLDEPFASLDANLRASIRSDVCAILRRSHTTTVLVTHDQDEALSTADEIAVLQQGAIGQLDTPRNLYHHPVDSELASFVGEANFVEGTAEGTTVVTAFGSVALSRPVDSAGPIGVLVLVRPEQLKIVTDGSDSGVPAQVLNVDFHGHDATVHLKPVRTDLPSSLILRDSAYDLSDRGDWVHLTVRGPVEAFPRHTVAQQDCEVLP